jgi:hypothetical protein
MKLEILNFQKILHDKSIIYNNHLENNFENIKNDSKKMNEQLINIIPSSA